MRFAFENPSDPNSRATRSFESEVLTLHADLAAIAKGSNSAMGRVDTATADILGGLAAMQELRDDVVRLERTMRTTELVTKLMVRLLLQMP